MQVFIQSEIKTLRSVFGVGDCVSVEIKLYPVVCLILISILMHYSSIMRVYICPL